MEETVQWLQSLT